MTHENFNKIQHIISLYDTTYKLTTTDTDHIFTGDFSKLFEAPDQCDELKTLGARLMGKRVITTKKSHE